MADIKDYSPWKNKNLQREIDNLKQEIKELKIVVINLSKKLSERDK